MSSSKMFQLSAIVIAIALVTYVVVFKIDWRHDGDQVATNTGQKRDILTYIPADTIFFFGGLEAASMQDAIDILSPEQTWIKNIDWSQVLKNEQNENASPAQKFVSGLYVECMRVLQNIERAGKVFGVGDEVDSVLYTIGAIPVMRIKLADATAFNAFIDRAEKTGNTASQKETLGSINFRSYSFDRPSDKKSSNSKLIVAESNGYGLFTVATPLEDEQTRHLILGADKPAKSLAQESILSELRGKYGYHPAYIGYVNHREVMSGLTESGGNDFGRMIDVLIKLAGENMKKQKDAATTQATQDQSNGKDLLAKIRTPECHTELMAIADNWPRTAFGYTEFDAKSQPKKFSARTVLESKDTAFLQSLSQIRGYIPSTVSNIDSKPVFGLGLGVNVDELLPFANTVVQSISHKDYKCPILADLKHGLAASNPAMLLGMMSGMVAGLQGVSAAVLDIDGSIKMRDGQTIPDIKSIDAIITISSANPQYILMMAANFMQGVPQIELPPDGTPIDFPLPIPLAVNDSPKLALKGNHLVAYIGSKGERAANNLANEALNANGIFTMVMDFGRYMNLVMSSMEGVQKTSSSDTEISAEEIAALKALGNLKGQFVDSFDVSKDGIEFNMSMTLE